MDDPKYGDLLVTIHGWWRARRGSKFHFRLDPVPGVRKPRRGNSYFRYPRTTQERNSGYIADELDHSTLTASQIDKLTRVRDLPHAWDDIPRGCLRRHSSWKRSRSTQYKGVEMDPLSCSRNSVGYEYFLDVEEVAGSSPAASTTFAPIA